MPKDTKGPKILVIRFSSIGDIVLTTPVVRTLKRQKNATIHFITKNSFRGILTANPYIDQVFSIEKQVNEVIEALKEEAYDYLIDLHHNLRSKQIRLALRKPTYAFDKINWQKWLLVNFKVNRLPKVHIVHRYMETVMPLGVTYDDQGLDYFIPEPDQLALDKILKPIDAQALSIKQLEKYKKKHFLALVVGAAHATKRMTKEQLLSIAEGVDWPVALLGGPNDRQTGEWLATQGGAHVVNYCGELNLHQSASVVEQASIVITHDTGLMHIAAAFRKRILVVWGNTIPEFGMYPFLPENEDQFVDFEVNGLRCRPCSKIGYQDCPKKHFDCMQQQDLEALVAHVNLVQ